MMDLGRRSAVTIRTVATRAGVSAKTVSRVLNNEPYVTAELKSRVLEATRQLGYSPNVHARRLARGRSGTLGVTIALSAEEAFGRLFFDEVMRGIGSVLDDAGLDLFVHSWSRRASPFDPWRQGKVDGLILMNVPVTDSMLAELNADAIPVVFTFCPEVDTSSTANLWWVDVDNVGGLRQAVRHLVELGHRRLLFLNGPRELAVSQLRMAGFRQEIDQLGGSVREVEHMWGEFSVESGRARSVERWRSARQDYPTGVVCGDDTIAIGVLEGARELGLETPRDISVVGFDDIVLARYVKPALTTIRQDAFEKGRMAAKMLVDRIAKQETARQVVLPVQLVVRDSTGRPPDAYQPQ